MSTDLRPILLIEDNPMDIDLTRRAFARRRLVNPLQVLEDGEAAMLYLDEMDAGTAPVPVVVLLDLKLPKVDGLDVLARIKQHPRFKVVPVVVLTTSAEDGDVSRAYQAGANSYIVKPVSFDKFLDVASQIEVYWGVLNQPSQ